MKTVDVTKVLLGLKKALPSQYRVRRVGERRKGDDLLIVHKTVPERVVLVVKADRSVVKATGDQVIAPI